VYGGKLFEKKLGSLVPLLWHGREVCSWWLKHPPAAEVAAQAAELTSSLTSNTTQAKMPPSLSWQTDAITLQMRPKGEAKLPYKAD